MRDVSKEPFADCCLVLIDSTGSKYTVIHFQKEKNIHPTSELKSHLSLHNLFAGEKKECRVILHTHPTELIALTQIKKYCSAQAINNLLWNMHPETKILIPEGAGFVPYILTGSQLLADKTVKSFENHDVVIWEKHGTIAGGKNLFKAFDLIDTANKAAKIFFLCTSSGFNPQGITKKQLKELYRPGTG